MTISRRLLQQDWYRPSLLFMLQRLVLSGLGVALYLLGYVPLTEDPIYRPYFGVAPDVRGISGALLGVWQRFDVIHFLRIAKMGYFHPDLSPFFPLFPMASRGLGIFLGNNVLLGSFLVANLACLLAINALYFWMLDEGYGLGAAGRTVLLLIWFPTSFYFFVPYSESLFLLLAVLAIWSSRRERWLIAGLLSMLAALTRIGGVVLSAVILVEWFMNRKGKSSAQAVRAWISATMPWLGFAGFMHWRAAQGFPSLTDVQAIYWQRLPALPWQGILQTLDRLIQGSAHAIEWLDLLVVLGMVVLGLLMFRKLPISLSVYHWGMLLLGLSQIRVGQPLSGQARFAILLIPAFIYMGLTVTQLKTSRALSYTFLVLNLFLAGQFALWGWVG
jgi:Gpi18-like mannosyltransferase